MVENSWCTTAMPASRLSRGPPQLCGSPRYSTVPALGC